MKQSSGAAEMGRREATASDTTLLVVVVDVNPTSWVMGPGGASLRTVLEHLCIYINAFRALHAGNRLAIIACHPGQPTLLLHASHEIEGSLHLNLIPALLSIARKAPAVGTSATALSSALSIALCHINRYMPADVTHQQAQILALTATQDDPAQYNSIMNCIFAAQRSSIMVDCCALRTSSTFMQQSAHMTGGVYLEPTVEEESGLSQLLITLALPDRFCRLQLRQPKAHDVDFRAACFLTNQMLDRAFVCSVCLSIFHHGDIIECPACRSRFPPPKVAPRKRKRPPAQPVTAPTGPAPLET
ncbi:transcription factor Tfb4-domain-containing protein [Pavlovales sp. CCMP2436]|nr:transcription factor Tfb4-domain-containing protein [Pavlovales sp. CCMP2436]|mmetsp:Transcript_27368/g.69129  ORF Transcript_27368/g.69129 Transcript_27368/m.69129 type:complete len:302 (+) Transcript_27368:104-1009(+)|eukprot:CAMPEP_0179865674 /NCGR_PEP_ID=MMETSP0982-20121206/17001_1 /TAXON_ID=483367 /ORGANISM="non described non described, Strain CCMP 2436" /LENGTH=301 /DNA_ID=CAMNT_0021754459 /DNA_START=40 /DNA_END=945 /DNA_ORIENTATION=-